MLIGYDDVILRFKEELPKVLLLRGLEGIGKSYLAKELARRKCKEYDVLELKTFTIDSIREISKYTSFLPYGSSCRVIIIDFDEVSIAMSNAMLKILEESKPFVKFILISSKNNILQTIISRSFVLDLSRLSEENVEKILISRGILKTAASKAAQRSRGSVKRAIESLSEDVNREQVLSLVNAILAVDLEMCIRLTKKFEDKSMVLFETFMKEQLFSRMNLAVEYEFIKDEINPRINSLTTQKIEQVVEFCKRPIRSSLKSLLCCFMFLGK